MNYATTPKQDYLSLPEIAKVHHSLVENPDIRRALTTALAEMQHRATANTPADNFNACAASHLRMLGAKDFMAIFYNLVETETAPERQDTTNLPSNVKQMMPKDRRN